jgi:hypothetical protein
MLTTRKVIRMLGGAAMVAGLYFGWVGVQTSHAQATGFRARTFAGEDIIQASGEDPFADCKITVRPGERNFPDTRVEPYVAVNPASAKHRHGKEGDAKRKDHRLNLIGVWQQDRWSSGAARGLVAGFSFDGGETWGQAALPFSRCAPGGLEHERASDPWVSIGPDGIAYVVSLSFLPDTAVAAMTSTDGGQTWQNLNVIKEDPLPFLFNDKEAVTADPVKLGTAYIVWDRSAASDCGPGGCRSFTQPTWSAKTVDRGLSWSPAKIIVDTGNGEATVGNQIVIDPNSGALYNFFSWFRPRVPPSAAFVKSTDGGDTWSAPQAIAETLSIGVRHPTTGEVIQTRHNDRAEMLAMLQAGEVGILAPGDPLRTGGILPEAAIDPHTGQLYVVWQDARFSGMRFDEVAIASSSDGGATWSAPARANTLTGSPAFTPAVQVNQEGIVAVSYYDFRNFQGERDTLPTDYWIAFSEDRGATFGDEEHLTGSFNILAAPFAGGFFVGDYQGLGLAGGAFVPFFVKTNCLDNSCAAVAGGPRPTDVYTTVIDH